MFIASVLCRIPAHHISRTLVIIVLLMSLMWVLSLNANGTFWYNDSRSLIDSAKAFLEKDYTQFTPSASDHGPGSPQFYSYYSWYPYQTGAMLWFVLIFLITGVGNITGFQVINAFLTAGIAWELWHISKRCGLNENALRAEALLLILCIPLFTSSAFVYTNTIGLFLILLAVLIAVIANQATSTLRICLLIGSTYLIAALAIMFKGTVVIFAIALTIYLILTALIKQRYWIMLFCCIMFSVSYSLSSLSAIFVESVVGQKFGTGISQLSWIDMGLNPNSASQNPGWWNSDAIDLFQLTNGDSATQSQAARQNILDSIITFLQNPDTAFHFFCDKLASEWTEPSYQTFHYTHLTETSSPGFLSIAFLRPLYPLVLSFENVYQTIIYIFALTGILKTFLSRKKITTNQLLAVTCISLCFLGGFGCFLLWEAKSIYTLPYMIMLIPLASVGLDDTMQKLIQLKAKYLHY